MLYSTSSQIPQLQLNRCAQTMNLFSKRRPSRKRHEMKILKSIVIVTRAVAPMVPWQLESLLPSFQGLSMLLFFGDLLFQ